MIVTTGQIIRIEVDGYVFERTSETPGLITVVKYNKATSSTERLSLHVQDVDAFTEAFASIAAEDIAYRKKEVK
jgi:hypothetical protein